MLITPLLLLLPGLVGTAFGAQIPLLAANVPPSTEPDTLWDFERLPSVNATGHLIFLSVGSLLQHWPNTLYRNGHTLVPGTVPPGTLLYHGTWKHEIPSLPDWVATDPEHANLFCFGNKATGCWQLTLMATRELNVLYFDGSSAAKMNTGTMDSQDVVIWGELKPEYMFDEQRRIKELCEWGARRGVDGFVRMEMDFETMLCDFGKGTRVVSFLNLVAKEPIEIPTPLLPLSDAPHSDFPTTNGLPPPSPRQRIPPLSQPPEPPRRVEPDTHKAFLVIESGSWQSHYPGDPRIQLDLTRLISFYDTDLFPSLVPGRFGKPRWEHRLTGISKEDVQRMHTKLDEAFSPRGRGNTGSGVDWKAIVKVIMNRYGQRLELLQYVLQGNLTGALQEGRNYTAIVVEAHDYTAAMLGPYIIHTAVPPPNMDRYNLSWAKPVYKECSTAHTASIEMVFRSQLTQSEQLILRSIQDTTKEICRVLARVWAEGSVLELDGFGSLKHASDSLQELVRRWEEDISGLMKWLAWDIWTVCRPACGFEEMCYLPTWPFFFFDPLTPPERWPPKVDDLPKPRCIRRLPPYTR